MGAKIIIIRGSAGSGKSTVADELRSKLNHEILYIQQDTFRWQITKAKNDENFGVRRNDLAKGAIISLLNWGVNACEYVILEGIFSTNNYYDMFDHILKTFNQIYAYYFDLPFEETVKRHSSRSKANLFGEAEMREWYKPKNYLTQIKEKLITAEMSKDDIVSMILTDIGKSDLISNN